MGAKSYTSAIEQLKPDPVYGSLLLSKFINCLMYDGKKATAQRVRGPGIFLGSYEDPARGYREHLEAQRAPYLTINPQSPASTLVFPPEPVPPYKGAFTASYMAGRTRK